MCDDMGKRRLSQSRRPVQQHMVKRFIALARRLDKDANVIDDLLLAGEIPERERAQHFLEFLFDGAQTATSGVQIFFTHKSSGPNNSFER